MKNIDLNALRTFLAICDTASFAEAAARVFKTQPAVSQQMTRLEEQLDIALFERRGRRKELTAAGLRLFDYGQRLMALHDELWGALHDETLIGPVRIGAPADIADTILPGLLARFARSNPKLSLEIHVGRSPFLMDHMRNGKLDLTISTRAEAGMPRTVLRVSPVIWLAARNFRLEPGQPLPLVLADEPSIFRRIALESLKDAGIAWTERYVSPTLAGIRAAVLAGLGVTARSIEMLGPELRTLGESDGLPALPDIRYYLYLRKDSENEAASRLFSLLAGYSLHR